MIYVLIAIVLFAALSFTLSRQSDTGDENSLGQDQAGLFATQLISYSAQVKSTVDQMLFTGSLGRELLFVLPTDATFNVGSHTEKVFHPEGGGLIPANLPVDATHEVSSAPPAGWYMGRFNNVEWTKTDTQDVLLVAHQIARSVCENINKKITGTTDIPALSVAPAKVLIDASFHSGENQDFEKAQCKTCADYHSLCVSNPAKTEWSFYNVIVAE